MESHKIIIGSRGSQLALWQANWVKSKFESINGEVEVQTRIIKTSGDKIKDIPLAKIGGKGLFVGVAWIFGITAEVFELLLRELEARERFVEDDALFGVVEALVEARARGAESAHTPAL